MLSQRRDFPITNCTSRSDCKCCPCTNNSVLAQHCPPHLSWRQELIVGCPWNLPKLPRFTVAMTDALRQGYAPPPPTSSYSPPAWLWDSLITRGRRRKSGFLEASRAPWYFPPEKTPPKESIYFTGSAQLLRIALQLFCWGLRRALNISFKSLFLLKTIKNFSMFYWLAI